MNEWRFSADTGGTFTDCLATGPDGSTRHGKVLSSGRLRTTIRGVDSGRIEIEPFSITDTSWLTGKVAFVRGKAIGPIKSAAPDHLILDKVPLGLEPADIIEVDSGLEAPVLAMKLLVPEAGDDGQALSFRLGTTKGTNALLEKKGAPVALFLSKGFEDLLVIRDQKRPDLFSRPIVREAPLYERVYPVAGHISSDGKERESLNLDGVAAAARDALAHGCTVAAICLLNSWCNSAHEEQVMAALREAGFGNICASSQVRPLIKYLDRAETTLINATLSPVMDAYLDRVEEEINGNPLWIMTSAGGLVSRERFHAVDSLVSGPAGGVLGAVEAGRRAGLEKIIALDMGGTSTDVSRWKERLELRQQIRVGQASILTPAMPIETVAAGGGSICGFRNGRLFVGPESAGADPGPASYGAGGPLCLTDIHLLLGRIDPAGFSIPIRLEDARQRLDEVMEAAGETDWKALAEGFLSIATERMAHAIRQVTLRDGEDPAQYGLVAFGGAGGLHACRVAEELGIKRIIFPSQAGILSARGIHHAPREAVQERQLFIGIELAGESLQDYFDALYEKAASQLERDGVKQESIEEAYCTVYIRLSGQETGLPVEWREGRDIREAFEDQFRSTFGYFPKSPSLEVVKIRLRLQEKPLDLPQESFAGKLKSGPFIISDPFATCFVEDGWQAVKGSGGSFELRPKGRQESSSSGEVLENVRRTLVMNRLEGLVEEMGDQLQRTALSTNIRERLDFSCALLDAKGRLLVNAPHIPVHLGAMGLCLRKCLQAVDIRPGDVVITNHPAYGGSHLPDVTLISGLFDEHGQCLGYLANRAHHAELGGRTPGSMPPAAASLVEEGVIISPQHLVRVNRDRFDAIEAQLAKAPYPSRAVRENRIDLEAQLAALQRGHQLFAALLEEYSSASIKEYFGTFFTAASQALDKALARAGSLRGKAVEELDDGHLIKVAIATTGEGLKVDFTGTFALHPGNLNATPAIVRSAVLYVLRLFVHTPMPLNEGLLEKVEIPLPECFLNPAFPAEPDRCPAVVGGNVETSQRVVDALIRALGLMAAGQGTMNNFLFGNEAFGYYETIGGGAGAGSTGLTAKAGSTGEGFAGASGVHVHMTNTAITDPEILEQRFPVICREFSLRQGSGGRGLFPGGNGLVREIEFLEPVTVSLLTQNRAKGPRGMNGGGDGAPGRQSLLKKDGTVVALDGITRVEVMAGEAIRIETPGGGGWGEPA
ncbi:MAG: hydantoinase B/oxoprolinase family protein [Puniceicoccaceae bacterium]